MICLIFGDVGGTPVPRTVSSNVLWGLTRIPLQALHNASDWHSPWLIVMNILALASLPRSYYPVPAMYKPSTSLVDEIAVETLLERRFGHDINC